MSDQNDDREDGQREGELVRLRQHLGAQLTHFRVQVLALTMKNDVTGCFAFLQRGKNAPTNSKTRDTVFLI
jgi:hypothetical protein